MGKRRRETRHSSVDDTNESSEVQHERKKNSTTATPTAAKPASSAAEHSSVENASLKTSSPTGAPAPDPGLPMLAGTAPTSDPGKWRLKRSRRLPKKIYCIRRGRKPGFYTGPWDAAGGASDQITGFKDALHQSFNSAADAEDFMNHSLQNCRSQFACRSTRCGPAPDPSGVRETRVNQDHSSVPLNGDERSNDWDTANETPLEPRTIAP